MKVYLKSKNLKEILIRKNKSQNWLAYRLEVSSGYMSQLMDGSRSPSPKLRERMMNILIEYKFGVLSDKTYLRVKILFPHFSLHLVTLFSD
jgi:hypothetical protein